MQGSQHRNSPVPIITAHTPGQPRGACVYGPNYWLVLRGPAPDHSLLAMAINAQTDDDAREAAEAQTVPDAGRHVVALVRLHHAAYNVAPDHQTLADWAIEAVSNVLGDDTRKALSEASPQALAKLLEVGIGPDLPALVEAVVASCAKLTDLARSVPSEPAPDQAGDMADQISNAGHDANDAADRLAVALDGIAEK